MQNKHLSSQNVSVEASPPCSTWKIAAEPPHCASTPCSSRHLTSSPSASVSRPAGLLPGAPKAQVRATASGPPTDAPAVLPAAGSAQGPALVFAAAAAGAADVARVGGTGAVLFHEAGGMREPGGPALQMHPRQIFMLKKRLPWRAEILFCRQ